MTEKEKLTLQKYEKYLYENNVSDDFMVSIIKLTLDYKNSGSINYLSSVFKKTKQYMHRVSKKVIVNGISIYTHNF